MDIIDGYNPPAYAMESYTVTMTVQEALDKLEYRIEGEPRVIYDHGSQFIGHGWRNFVKGACITDIKTRIAHPESNGRLERLHREEGLTEETLTGLLCSVGCYGALG